MVNISDIDLYARDAAARHLGMATQAEVYIPLREQFGVNRPVRAVANGTPLAQGLMFKHKRPGLLAMARSASFIETRHGKAACRFADVRAVGIVAFGAIHFVFQQRMMLGQMKLGFRRAVALEAGRRVLGRVHNEFPLAASTRNMQAAWPVT